MTEICVRIMPRSVFEMRLQRIWFFW